MELGAEIIADGIPPMLASLARQIEGKSWEAAKRLIVSKVGSVGRGDRFSEDVADAVFLRLQRTAQVGQYDCEALLLGMGRNARRLDGEGTITLYRSAPRGAGIRPGDFASDDIHEVGYYAHGGNVVHRMTVPRHQVIALEGSTGDGREYVLLPRDYVRPRVHEHYASFAEFFEAVHVPEAEPASERDPVVQSFTM